MDLIAEYRQVLSTCHEENRIRSNGSTPWLSLTELIAKESVPPPGCESAGVPSCRHRSMIRLTRSRPESKETGLSDPAWEFQNRAQLEQAFVQGLLLRRRPRAQRQP